MNRKTELMIKGWIAENGLNINACNGGIVSIVQTIQRLIKRHQVQCVNSCNGEGIVKGQRYYNGVIDDYAKRTYGYSVKSAYIFEDETIFDAEIEKIQNRLKHECGRIGLVPEFQHDPRGATVKLNRKEKLAVNRTGTIKYNMPCTWLY